MTGGHGVLHLTAQLSKVLGPEQYPLPIEDFRRGEAVEHIPASKFSDAHTPKVAGQAHRIGIESGHVGHSHVSMTQGGYLNHRIHTEVADLLDRTSG